MRAAMLLLVLVVPAAAAAALAGELTAASAVTLPGGASIASSPPALFIPDAGAVSLEAQAATILVRVFEYRYASADVLTVRPIVPVDEGQQTWRVDEATIRLEPSRPGWVGVRFERAGAFVETAAGDITIRRAVGATLGNGDGPATDAEDAPFFFEAAQAPALSRSSASWTFAGAARVKTLGPTVLIESAQNSTRIETGEMQDPSNPAGILRRHVVLELDGAEVASAGRADVFSASARATWDGELVLASARGTIAGGAREWSGAGDDATLDGAFSATILPLASEDRLHLEIAGDLRSTSLAASTRAPQPPVGGATAALILLAAVAAAGATAHVLLRRRAARDPPLSIEEQVALANAAADAEDFARAADLMGRARERTPTSLRLAIDEAYYLHRAGKDDEALARLAARLVADDVDAHVLRARILALRGDEAAAEAPLLRALEKAPIVSEELARDPDFELLRKRPLVAKAMREARRKSG